MFDSRSHLMVNPKKQDWLYLKRKSLIYTNNTVYRVILARWKFRLYWRMTKIRQIKKRQFFQLQNLKMCEIELHYLKGSLSLLLH